MQPTSHPGMTLIELLVVLVLVSITAAAALPSFYSLVQRIHARAVQTSLQQAIEDTRLLALVQRQTLILCGTDNGRQCTKSWENGWLRKTTMGKVLDTQQFHSEADRLYDRLFPTGRFVLVFSSSGRSETENGTFWYCPARWPSPAWALSLDRFGKARVLPADNQGRILDGHGKVLTCRFVA